MKYRIFITTCKSEFHSGCAVAIHSQVIEFDSKDEAEIAYECLRSDPGDSRSFSIKLIRLYLVNPELTTTRGIK